MANHNPSFLDNIGTDLATIRIGEGDAQESFPVHKDLLVACSPYFKAALEGKFVEAADKAIPIPDITSRQFKLFLNWLYFRNVPKDQFTYMGTDCCANCKPSGSTCEESRRIAGFTKDYDDDDEASLTLEDFPPLADEVDQQLETLIATGPWDRYMLYVFADRCDVPALRQQLIDKVYKGRCELYGAVIYATRRLANNSPLRRLMLDKYTTEYTCDTVRGEKRCGTEVLLRQKLPVDFILSLLDMILNGQTGMKPLCAYHEHEQDEETIKECQGRMWGNE
ncbi:hypothetical protein FKW77_004228 [Venturia effusa]|uniref:BTB domain-containing protein n=1 Tax=Venturia effusa TaxID=50376 RepID=A0A517LLB7_9PEZI|nr:hypothetical protein FKW77_004228 [Venturia effusa]